MATHKARLSEFVTDRLPSEGAEVEVLCQDHVGTYLAPFLCRHDSGVWMNAGSGEPVAAAVIGWREWLGRKPRKGLRGATQRRPRSMRAVTRT
jgi:hypothetical protein